MTIASNTQSESAHLTQNDALNSSGIFLCKYPVKIYKQRIISSSSSDFCMWAYAPVT